MRLYIFFLLVIISIRVGAQTKNLDSLKQTLQKAALQSSSYKTDTNYIITLARLANELTNYNPDSAFNIALEAKKLADEIDLDREKVEAIACMGKSRFLKSEYDEALKFLNEALLIAKEINYKKGEARVLVGIGLCHWRLDKIPLALEYFLESIKIYELIKDNQGIAYNLNNIAVIHENLRKLPEALDYYSRALEKFKEIGDEHGTAMTLHNIGNVLNKQNHIEAALEKFRESLGICNKINDKGIKLYVVNGMAAILINQNKYADAINYYSTGIALARELDDKYGFSYSLCGLGDSYFRLGQFDKAENYTRDAMQIATEINSKDILKDCNEILSKIYEGQGMSTKALHHYKLFKLYSDSLTNLEIEENTATLQAQYEFEKKENALKEEQALQNAEHERRAKMQKLAILGVSIILSFVLIVAVIQYRNRRKIQRAYSKLEKANTEIQNQKEEIGRQNIRLENQNEQLIKLNEEKNSLIQLVAHDLKTPIHHVSGFATILKSEMKDDQKYHIGFLDKILDSTNRLNKMIANILNIEAIESGEYELKYEKVEVAPLLQQLVDAFRLQAVSKNIMLQSITNPEMKSFIRADKNYLYQIIENLISNALKFSPNNKKIFVILKEGPNDTIRISIKDEGPGITEQDKAKLFGKFQRLSAKPIGEEKSTGLGLSIAKKFTEMMGGQIWCESEPGNGAEFIIQFTKL